MSDSQVNSAVPLPESCQDEKRCNEKEAADGKEWKVNDRCQALDEMTGVWREAIIKEVLENGNQFLLHYVGIKVNKFRDMNINRGIMRSSEPERMIVRNVLNMKREKLMKCLKEDLLIGLDTIVYEVLVNDSFRCELKVTDEATGEDQILRYEDIRELVQPRNPILDKYHEFNEKKGEKSGLAKVELEFLENSPPKKAKVTPQNKLKTTKSQRPISPKISPKKTAVAEIAKPKKPVKEGCTYLCQGKSSDIGTGSGDPGRAYTDHMNDLSESERDLISQKLSEYKAQSENNIIDSPLVDSTQNLGVSHCGQDNIAELYEAVTDLGKQLSICRANQGVMQENLNKLRHELVANSSAILEKLEGLQEKLGSEDTCKNVHTQVNSLAEDSILGVPLEYDTPEDPGHLSNSTDPSSSIPRGGGTRTAAWEPYSLPGPSFLSLPAMPTFTSSNAMHQNSASECTPTARRLPMQFETIAPQSFISHDFSQEENEQIQNLPPSLSSYALTNQNPSEKNENTATPALEVLTAKTPDRVRRKIDNYKLRELKARSVSRKNMAKLLTFEIFERSELASSNVRRKRIKGVEKNALDGSVMLWIKETVLTMFPDRYQDQDKLWNKCVNGINKAISDNKTKIKH